MIAELERLESHLGGVADMKRQPDAMLVVDLRKEAIAVRKAKRLGLPVIGLVDTNCDPDDADFVIPGNDDAIRSSALIMRVLADGVAVGRNRGVKVSDFVSENGEGAEGEAPEGGAPADEAEAAAEAPAEAAEEAPAAPAAEAPAAPAAEEATASEAKDE